MGISFDQHLGVHQDALALRSQRATVIAGNIANVDTPGYKALDLNFTDALQQVRQGSVEAGSSVSRAVLEERTQTQPSADGNTVEIGREQAAWAQNNTEWETSFAFLNAKFKSLESAITGQ